MAANLVCMDLDPKSGWKLPGGVLGVCFTPAVPKRHDAGGEFKFDSTAGNLTVTFPRLLKG